MTSEQAVVNKGLDDIFVNESRISFVDGARGKLLYQGFDIDDLTKFSTFEEVAYITWYNELPTASQLEELKKQLRTNRNIPDGLISLLRTLPSDAHPMDVLRTGVSALASYDSELNDNSREANIRKSIRLTAKMPTIVAAFTRIREGYEPVAPDPELDHAANFLYMLSGNKPGDLFASVMDVALILHLEHEMNASTFACIVTASTLADIYSTVVSGIGTLQGPLHGGANEASLKTLQEIGGPEKAEEYVLRVLREKKKIPGFGHRVYKTYDPRAVILKEYVRRLGEMVRDTRLYDTAVTVEDTMVREVGKAKGVFPNLDFYSGITYHLLGIPTDIFPPIFAIARVVGWTAHILEYLEDNRLVRPRSLYVGPVDRKYVPPKQRALQHL